VDTDSDEARLAQLAEYELLGGPPRPELQALVALAAQVCDVPRAAINLITGTQQVQAAAVGMEPAVCARSDSMCAAVLHEGRPVVLPDASLDPRFADNPFVTGVIGKVRFYAAHQLTTPAGVVIGTLCVFDDEPRELDQRQRDALRSLADRVVDMLELSLRTRQLETSLDQLTRTRDELRRSNEQLAGFAAQAAHDLRNPLTSVSMSLEMLAEQESVHADEDASWMVERAVSGTGRMDRMITDLLEFGRVGGGLQVGDVDLASVLEDVRNDLAVQLEGAELVVGELPVVRGDATQLRLTLQNLVANAVKFTRPVARPRVVVSARPTADGWRVEVADNGPGVAVDQRERVLEPLVQGDRKADGIGLGLAICARVVRAHGGTIGVEEAPDGGALVWFELPQCPEAARR
jgi:signal transduction histidine kinase